MYINEEGYLVVIRYEKTEWNCVSSWDRYFEWSHPVEHEYKVTPEGKFEEVKDS